MTEHNCTGKIDLANCASCVDAYVGYGRKVVNVRIALLQRIGFGKGADKFLVLHLQFDLVDL